MAIEVKLPELGEGIESGDVLEVLVSEGDTVKAEQGLFELETDKATVTVPSPSAGKVVKLLVSAGDTVEVGSVLAQLEAADGAGADDQSSEPEDSRSEGGQAEESPAAEESEEQDEAASEEAQPQAEEKSAKTKKSQSKESATESKATAKSKPEPQSKKSQSQQPETSQSSPSTARPAKAQVASESTERTASAVPAGPAVRRFAREVGVDLSHVRGSGDGGRITRDDVLRAVRESNSTRATSEAASPSSTSMTTTSAAPATRSRAGGNKAIALPGDPGHDDYGPVRVERMSKIRKTIANQMHKSWSTVPRVTNFDDADVTDLEAFRTSSKDDYAAQGIKLTTMPFLIKAVATALRHHPTMNALLDLENDKVIYRDYVNVGIAVDTDRGLVVPNIRNVDTLSIPGIAQGLADLAARVRNGDFGVNELRGGTFTISNLGAIGGTYSTPIVNIPEVAILLIGRTRKLPVVMEDESIQARQMMPLSLSYDHRLVDGGTAARFLNDVIAYLEAPSRLLLAIP